MQNRRAKRWLSIALSATLISSLPAPAVLAGSPGRQAAGSAPAGAEQRARLDLNLLQFNASRRAALLIATEGGQAQAVAQRIESLGGRVLHTWTGLDFIIADVPAQRAAAVQKLEGVKAAALNRPVRLDRSEMTRPADIAAPAGDPQAVDVKRSLQITRGEIGADRFSAAQNTQGEGSVIAVLDTGVDPGHPDLQTTPNGERKIVQWLDFTGEGDVDTQATVAKDSEAARQIGADQIPTQSGTFHTGVFKEQQIPDGEMGQDINRNGKKDDTFTVLVTDANKSGVYDTVYIDTNGNGDLRDEQPLRAYAAAVQVGERGVGRFGQDNPETPAVEAVDFVVTTIAADGSRINLGYDGGLHGTHVAGIAAGNGAFQGVAPAAKIIAIKVLTSGGHGDWAGIIRGIEYAAQAGATVVNMSLGGMDELNDGQDPQSLLINRLAREKGAVFSIAAGNSGPGLNTAALPGVATEAITSGAYVSPETFANDYNLKGVPSEGLWYFSSTGPRDDGGLKPNVVAPGAARASVPGWAGSYAVFQGTSMAAPQTAGAVALLASAAQKQGVRYTAPQMRKALEMGARPLAGYTPVEQGHGLIQVDKAFDHLRKLAKESAAQGASGRRDNTLYSVVRNDRVGWGPGLYARESAPGAQGRGGAGESWSIVNTSGRAANLQLHSDAAWIEAPARLSLGPIDFKTLTLRYNLPQTAGLYSALVRVIDPGRYGAVLELLNTVVVPHELSAANSYTLQASHRGDGLEAAKLDRYFVRVPQGARQLAIKVAVPAGPDGQPQGRVRAIVTRPNGLPGPAAGYAGRGPNTPAALQITQDAPEPGVWEVDVYASHGAPSMGVALSQYNLTVQALGVYGQPSTLRVSVPVLPILPGNGTHRVEFANFLGQFRGQTVGTDLVRPEPVALQVKKDQMAEREFDVPMGAAALQLVLDQVRDPLAKIKLDLYRNDPKAGWQLAATGERILLPAPLPGHYALVVTGLGVPSGETSVTVTRAIATVASAGAKPAATAAAGSIRVDDAMTARAMGDRWTALAQVVPAAPGGALPAIGSFRRALGAVAVVDEQGNVVGAVPVEME